jgi:ABC-2 type transport system ATP-binding protein
MRRCQRPEDDVTEWADGADNARRAGASVIEAADLHKSYGSVEALRGLNLQVPRGSIHGFLGRNGAGKTTTIKVLLGMAKPTGGSARVFGLPSDAEDASVEIRRRTGFVSDDKDLYDYMTVAELIRFTAAFFPTWRADLEQTYVRKFELPLDRKVKALSRGTQTKVALLLVLCRRAELLILDEPTSGLDPAVTEEILQTLVSHVASDAMTVFFSSHQISEIDQIADRVTIIDRGRAVVSGALDDLREQYRRVQLVFDGDAPDPLKTAFRARGIVRVQRSGRILSVLTSAGADELLDETRALNPTSTDVVPVTLKEIFLESVAAED